ncbi:3-phosphoshikimate 1-carboxyvinyltransferase [Ignavibacteriales bacterium]
MSLTTLKQIKRVKGELLFNGDKSVSHRAVIFAAMADGESVIKNISLSDDVKSSINCLAAMGARFEQRGDDLVVTGVGFKGFKKPETVLDAGNSGTTARLFAGLLSAQDFEATLTGDDSLKQRPMERVANPLKKIGAKIELTDNFLPTTTKGKFKSAEITLEVASAQVKSALILAGLHLGRGKLTLIDPFETRNHTEEMLGIPREVHPSGKVMTISRAYYPKSGEFTVPGDVSSAMFFIVLTLIAGDTLRIKNLLLSPERIMAIEILKRMGGQIIIDREETGNCGKWGDIFVKRSDLINIEIEPELIPLIIDEIPALTIAGLFAEGGFQIKNAAELRVKETDRISAIVKNLQFCGAEVAEYEDGFLLYGKDLDDFAVFESYGDHRIAMAFSVLASLLNKGGKVNQSECVAVSNPAFYDQLASISMKD